MTTFLKDWARRYGKNTAEIVAVIAVLAFIAVLIWGPSTPADQVPEAAALLTADATIAPADGSVPAADGTVTTPAPEVPARVVNKPLTYEQAVELYGAYRIQFVNCNGQPGNVNAPKGTKVMLDNRDKIAHTVKVGTNKTYKVASLGFALAVMTTPGEYPVLCDEGGAGTITVN